jgi:hypothetical protein
MLSVTRGKVDRLPLPVIWGKAGAISQLAANAFDSSRDTFNPETSCPRRHGPESQGQVGESVTEEASAESLLPGGLQQRSRVTA